MPLRTTPSVAEQEGQQTETEATGAPQKHHYTLNQQVGSITRAQNEISEHIDSFLDKNNIHSRLNFIIARPLFSHTP
ncbi:hypothetical protein, partial [Klebsiella pneumoniae]|uniref:hypothetical protein n=2 Tax=Klebsiella pneumoniae TaxID=573 RepID=UPI00207676B7